MASGPVQALHHILADAPGLLSGRALFCHAMPVDGHDALTFSAAQAQSFAGMAGHVYDAPDSVAGPYDTVCAAIPKQKDEAAALIAHALSWAQKSAVFTAANDAGGKTLEKLVAGFGVPVASASKHKSRVVWTNAPQTARRSAIDAGLALARPVALSFDGQVFETMPGVFGWDKVDRGSALLTDFLKDQALSGDVADLGCGYGYLSARMADFPGISSLTAIDDDARAVQCCRRNLGDRATVIWADVTAMQAGPRFDAVVMNPPFHTGKNQVTALGQEFMRQGMAMLKSGGRLFAVANRHLPYEKTVPGLRVALERDGFKILTGTAS